uniref:JexG protein n=1 Tax=Paenibacillus jamilae TaxID=114136 RepID=Q3MSA1_9BACL|nr:JexG protein [Paenibacillus jamilae]
MWRGIDCLNRLFRYFYSLYSRIFWTFSDHCWQWRIGCMITFQRGPFIFKPRTGGFESSQPFRMYQIRSMKVLPPGTEDTGWTTANDPRRTRFGTFIRKTSLDELPQFFNVLLGDMSVVGPRPERPYYVDQFREEIPKYMVKHHVRLESQAGHRATACVEIHLLRNGLSMTSSILRTGRSYLILKLFSARFATVSRTRINTEAPFGLAGGCFCVWQLF